MSPLLKKTHQICFIVYIFVQRISSTIHICVKVTTSLRKKLSTKIRPCPLHEKNLIKIFSIFLKLRVPISLNYIINYTGENALLVEVICGIFAYSHGAINPVFYYLHNKTLRSAYRNFFGIFFKKEKQNIETVLTIPNQRRVDNITLSKIN